ncbi:MAG TPA: amino acid adenylation domain-containing protein [Longimicrobiaceae bacterium]|nr:amino acid adenylation domain-containing protein [Longimicrobiaceae bacterium]
MTRLRSREENHATVPLPAGCDAPGSLPADVVSVHHLFELQAERMPHRVAVVSGEERLTYGELNRRANHLARLLRGRSVKPGAPVAVYMERTVDAVTAFLGALKAGAAFVPLDPDLPEPRLLAQLAEIGETIVLTQRSLAHRLGAVAMKVVRVDGDLLPDGEAGDDPRITLHGEAPAYVVFTSGSTGVPKGVVIPHRSLTSYSRSVISLLGLTEEPPLNFGVVTSLAADLGYTCLFPALATGGTLHLVPPRVVRDAERFAAYVEEHGIDVLKLTPSYLGAIAAWGDVSRALPRRYLVVGGEPFPFALCERVLAAGPRCALFNHYGPAETTVGVACTLVTDLREWRESASSVPIGRPIAHASLYLLDVRLDPVPDGAPGEIYVGGAGVGSGYLRRPDLTAERFLPDPFGEPGARMYRTGDLGRRLPDGALEFLGRIDRQTKIRGFRVEPEEVEAVLRTHPGVAGAAVTVRAAGDRRTLVAHVVPTPAGEVDAGALKAFLRSALPEYMIPGDMVLLQRMPLTPSGKVDYAALQEGPAAGTPEPETEPDPDPVERMRQVWQLRLGVARVELEDDFFALGGDSIVAIGIAAELRQLGMDVTPQHFFDRPTLAEQVRHLGWLEPGPGARMERGGPLPLTPVQRWFFEQGLAEAHHWNQAVLLEVEPGVEPGRLGAALARLVRRHDALRLSFRPNGAGWEQAYTAAEAISLRYESLAGLHPEAVRQAMERVAAGENAALDLDRAPLLRAVLFDCGSSRPGRLLLVAHHLVVDGVSWRILLEELEREYRRGAEHTPAPDPPPGTPFGEWTEVLASYAGSAEALEEAPYWRTVERIPSGHIPVDYPAGANLERSAATVWCALSAAETAALLRCSAGEGSAPLPEVLLAALVRSLAAWGGTSAVTLDVEGHGREELVPGVDLTRTVGWFTSLFPLAVGGDAEEPFAATLARVGRALRAVPRRGIGYGVLRYLRPDSGVSGGSREMAFNYLGRFQGDPQRWRPAREVVGGARGPRGRRTHVLKLTGLLLDDALWLNWSFSRDLHRPATVERLVRAYAAELRAFLRGALGERAGALPAPRIAYRETSADGLPLSVPELPVEEPCAGNGHGPDSGGEVLLTGATGYLGIYLLRELLAAGRTRVNCLVRAASVSEAEERLAETWRWYFPDEELGAHRERVRAVTGDIRAPGLGLAPGVHRELLARVETVFHSAADVRLIGRGEEIAEANVTGTRNVLEFATSGRPRALHHVSTLSVAGVPPAGAVACYDEECFDVGQDFPNPYARSKFEAERMLRDAMARGARVVVYRSGNISADSRTGRFQRNVDRNRVYLALRSCIQTGAAPYLPDLALGFSYVDTVARALVALSGCDGVEGRTFHPENTRTVSFYDLIRCLQAFGYPIVLLDPAEYVRSIGAAARDEREPLFSLGSTWGRPGQVHGGDEFVFGCARTEALLERLGVEFPRPTTAWLRAVVQHCINVRFLRAPLFWDRIRQVPDVLGRSPGAPAASEMS